MPLSFARVVLIFSWLMVFVVGCQNAVSTITPRALVFLALSGTATGLSWLCYFKALSIGNLSKVVAVDKSSTFLTILLALIFFREPFHWLTGLGIAVMIAGTALMLEKGDAKGRKRLAVLRRGQRRLCRAAVHTGQGGRAGYGLHPGHRPAHRGGADLCLGHCAGQERGRRLEKDDPPGRRTSGAVRDHHRRSWLCYYRALQTGSASVVVPIDKCSMLFAVALSAIFLKEKQTRRSLLALALVVAGTFHDRLGLT